MNVLARDTKVGGGGFAVPIRNGKVLAIARADYLASLLRRVRVYEREPAVLDR